MGDDARRWGLLVRPYGTPDTKRSIAQIFTTVPPIVACELLAYRLLDVSLLLALLVDVVTAGFLIRLFILQHDCGHGSFFKSQKWNDVLGTLIGYVMFTPYYAWRHDHAVHHATTGDLQRRGTGDVRTLTVREYEALPPLRRWGYRLYRNPFVMFGLGAVFVFMVLQRFMASGERGQRLTPRDRENVHATTLAGLALLAVLWLFGGWQAVLLVHLPAMVMAGAAGIFLFFVQHQYDDSYWRPHERWDFASASMHGSSYLKLPPILRFFTGHIGVHNVHHLSPKVPNYKLQRAIDENDGLREVHVLTLGDALRTVRLKLYDEESGRMIGWRELRRRRG